MILMDQLSIFPPQIVNSNAHKWFSRGFRKQTFHFVLDLFWGTRTLFMYAPDDLPTTFPGVLSAFDNTRCGVIDAPHPIGAAIKLQNLVDVLFDCVDHFGSPPTGWGRWMK